MCAFISVYFCLQVFIIKSLSPDFIVCHLSPFSRDGGTGIGGYGDLVRQLFYWHCCGSVWCSNKGYLCAEIVSGVPGAWQKVHILIRALQKMHILITVSQDSKSHLSLCWATHLGVSMSPRGCPAKAERIPRSRSQQHGDPGERLSLPSLGKCAVNMMASISWLLCFSRQSSTKHL